MNKCAKMWINFYNFEVKFVCVTAIILTVLRNAETRSFSTSLSTDTNTSILKQTIETNSIQHLLAESSHSRSDSNRSLKRVFLSNRTVTCNDGSQAGFYLRKSTGSNKWVVFLEGGWHCYDLKSCRTRWLRLRHLMTSAQWPETRDVGGILSPMADDNPFWHNANHVLVPYCSSDSWSGTKIEADSRDGWRFMGSLIIRQVIADLIPLGLGRTSNSELLLVGSSAGGLGVMLNVDQVRHFLLNERKLKVTVRGVSDSGWFLDREPYTPGAVAASEAVRQGWKMWEGSPPEACVKQHPVEPWRCYFGHRLYPTLKSPLFIFQWLFDEAQMRADSVGAPVTPQQWDYIHDMGGALRTSLNNVTAVFAPSCIGHSVLTKRDWLNIKIDDISLAQALRCWEKATNKRRNNGRRNSRRNGNKRRNRKPNNGNKNLENNEKLEKKLSKEERVQRKRHNERRRGHKRLRDNQGSRSDTLESFSENRTYVDRSHNRRKKNPTNVENTRNNNPKRKRQEHHNQEQQQHNHKNRQKNHANLSPLEPKRCSLRLLEKCSWPQCNHSCPTLTNPLTGEEMRFLELLASFGLDIEAVATALGVDMQTLNNMDHTELVNLLTQQVS